MAASRLRIPNQLFDSTDVKMSLRGDGLRVFAKVFQDGLMAPASEREG
jgi:hypothetical protein